MLMYESATRTVQNKVRYLNDENKILYGDSLIDSFQSRIKQPRSILEKAERKGIPRTFESLTTNLHDIAGVRLIVRFLDDIWKVKAFLDKQDDMEIVRVKDYVRHPKANGYRSLHLIVTVPIYLSAGKEQVEVEIQIRTIAMNFWASLEHELNYKKNVPHQGQLRRSLTAKAGLVSQLDTEMNAIKETIRNETEPD
ncbi:GTP pyrophosphokinase [Levilactobacillus bambusae]|uniref:GTP pyrophosphokinase n=2 Tax=Levilactobacillus bambusae TaxID=2024736 RepID=A0A2V1N0K7_9LACO|nr:GTP pyrophosphokinase [Levilactobacillus bambusae]